MKRNKFWGTMLVIECIFAAFWTVSLIGSAVTGNISDVSDTINNISLAIIMAGVCFYYWDRSKQDSSKDGE